MNDKTEIIVRCIKCGQFLYEYTLDDVIKIDKQYQAYMLMEAEDCEFIICEKCETEDDIARNTV